MNWIFFASLSALLSATVALIEKKVLNIEHAMQFSTALAFINAIISIPFVLFLNTNALNTKAVVLIYISSFLATLGFLFISKATRHLDVSFVSPLLVVGPGVSAFLAYIFLGESLSIIKIIGLVILIISAYTLSSEDKSQSLFSYKSKYLFFVFASLLMYGASSIFDRYIVSRLGVSPLIYVSLIQIFIAFNFIVLISVLHDGPREVSVGLKKFGWIMLLISFLTVSYRFAQIQAVSHAYVGLVEAVKRSSVLLTVILSGRFFHEKNLLFRAIIALMMILGVILVVWR